MTDNLGTASLRLEVDLTEYEKNMKTARGSADDVQHSLDALAAVSKIAQDALKQVKMSTGQGAESKVSAEGIVSGVRGVSEEARTAARELDKVKLTSVQAAETRAAADVEAESLKKIGRQAEETTVKIEAMNRSGRNGAGVGPFGSGFGRIGVLGAAVGGGVLTGPAAAPAALGLLASLPVLATTGIGALGTLALAFQGVSAAIGGDKKAFDALVPAQQSFVLTLRSLDGALDKLKQTAASNLFPGLTEGLKSALSPGTMGAVTNAVTLFAKAIGNAGAAWGRYFGSVEFQSIFGPLMQAGAKNLGLMSDAALHLFDAMGVLARAAIPLTQWMVTGIDAASRWADGFLHAKDATGALAGSMNEAKTSLQLVGNLFGALLNAVYQLGAALYPVSKVAVKDLTDGLNALAGIFDRNKQTIRDLVSGALSALVSTVKTAYPIVAKLAEALNAVVKSVGSWKGAFEIVIGGSLALKFLSLSKSVAMVGQASKAAAIEAGGFRAALLGLGGPEVLAAIAAAAAGIAVIKANLQTDSNVTALPPGSAGAGAQGGSVFERGGKWYQTMQGGKSGVMTREITAQQAKVLLGASGNTPTIGPGSAHSGAANVGPSVVSGPGDFKDESPALRNVLDALAKRYGAINLDSGYRSDAKQTALWDASVKAGHAGFMPNGNPIARPASRGGTGSDHSRGTAADGSIFYQGKWTPLSSLPPAILAAYGLSTVAGDVGHVMLASGGSTTTSFGTDPAFTKNLGTIPKSALPTGANLLPTLLGCRLIRLPKRPPVEMPTPAVPAEAAA